jgi:photosystem II stability/assembly factor-like uncharacterized protein
MKRCIFTITMLFLFIVLIRINAQENGKWEILNEPGWFGTIDFVSEQAGWITRNGALLKTEDGGETWQSIHVEIELESIDFINESVGWAKNELGIYQTEDGGQSWVVQKELQNADFIHSICVVNDSVIFTEGIVAEAEGYNQWWVLKSTDAGLSWEKIFSNKTGLPSNRIMCIAIDSSDNKWIGTKGGLARFDGTDWTIYNYSNSGLPDNIIRCITIDSKDNKWIGTTGGLARFDGTDWTIYNSSNSGLPDNSIWCIAIDSSDIKWIGTRYAGLARFDGSSWKVYDSSNSPLGFEWIRSIAIDSLGDKWIAPSFGGLAMFDGSNWDVYDQLNSGLPSNSIMCIAIDSKDNKWIGTGNGLAMFDGADWDVYDQFNSGLPSNYIRSITIDGRGNKWIGTDNDGLVMYDDSSWSVYDTSSSGLPGNQVRTIAVDSSGNKWIGTEDGGLAVFDGRKWIVYNYDPNTDQCYNSLSFYNEEIGVVTGSLKDTCFVLRTNNGGNTWHEKKLADFVEIDNIQFINDSTAYFKAEKHNGEDEQYTLCLTTDTFSSWTELISDDVSLQSYCCLDEKAVFALVGDDSVSQVMKSTDGGFTWLKISEPETEGDIYFLSEYTGFIRNGSELHRSTDGGITWHLHLWIINYPLADVFFLDRIRGFICGGRFWGPHDEEWWSEGRLFSTIDGGTIWKVNFHIEGGAGECFAECIFLNENVGFLSNRRSIYKTIDSGNRWDLFFPSENDSINCQFNFTDMEFKNDQVSWLAGWAKWADDSSGAGILGTTDGGSNWELVWKYPDTEEYQYSLDDIHFVNTTGWAVGESGMILRYTEHDNWQPMLGMTDLPLQDVFFSDEQHGWIAGGYINEQDFQSIILRTNDAGETWTQIRLDKYLINDMYFADSLCGWVVGKDTSRYWGSGVILKTSTGGENWTAQVKNLSTPLTAVHFKDGFGWAVGERGLVLRTEDGSTWVDERNNKIYPSKFELSQNYPNPFNPSTNIEFTLPKSEFTTLKVFNTLGQKVATLVSKKLNQRNHTYTFDGRNLASGIYYYQLVAGDYMEVKKMILLK